MAGLSGRSLLPKAPKDTEGTFQPLCACVWLGVCGGVGEKTIQRGAPETETSRQAIGFGELVLWERLEQEPSSVKLSRARTARLRWGGGFNTLKTASLGKHNGFFLPLHRKATLNLPT